MLHKTAADLLKRTKDKQKTAKLKLMKQWEEEASLRNRESARYKFAFSK
jgi:hypothetical protein